MTKSSEDWFEKAQKVLPGGVSSPVRAYGAVGGTPRVIAAAKGAEITDVDGNTYLDFVGSWGPLILGHAHPDVVKAVTRASKQGMSYGAPCRAEIKLAERVVDAYPGIEQVRFVSSGTEAVMSAVRLARGATGRDLIVKFSGCYHGHMDSLLVAAGSGLATFGRPSSDGVPENFTNLTRVLKLDDDEGLIDLFRTEGARIAAVIIEPIPANNGLLVQRPDFLQLLRDQCSEHGALLIFDEVISGFRIGKGGAADYYGITPDIATFGKVIGGGMPVGAFASTREIMQHLAPLGGVYQAGTLSGNPVAMTAGLETLKIMSKDDGWAQLDARGQYLEILLNPLLENAAIDATLSRVGSMFWIALHANTPPRCAEAISAQAGETYAGIFHALLARGIALAPSAYEIGFISMAHSRDDLDQLAATLGHVLNDVTPTDSGETHDP
ncbi:MAG: glutamate-1-semialdehyde 2,1-aminomutase [Candidatus Rariloculaceae bacterium]